MLRHPEAVSNPFYAMVPTGVWPILSHHVARDRALHETVILLTVRTEHEPTVPEADRIEVVALGGGVWRVVVRYGYFENPDIPRVLERVAVEHSVPLEPSEATYYLGREQFLATGAGRMRRFTELFFAFLSRNALSATAYFRLPPERVVELGMQLDL